MEHLIIRHFGPVKDIKVDILPLTIFIGTQGGGKSTVSKVLTICRDMNWILAMLNNKVDDLMIPFVKFGIAEYFNDDTIICYKHNSEGVSYEIKYGESGFEINSLSIERDIFRDLVQNMIIRANRSLLEKLGETDLSNPDVLNKYSRIINANSRTTLYVPAERNLVGMLSDSLASMLAAQIPLYDALVEYMSVFEKAKYALKTYNVDFLRSSFIQKDGREMIEIHDSITGEVKSLPLQSCSSGLQSVLPLVMVMDYSFGMKCFNSFVIEEPEQNLFPSNQRELLKFILSRCKESLNVVITTHSPYLLSYLNVALLLGRVISEYGEDSLKDNGYTDDFVSLKSSDVAVYSLDPDDDVYCKSMIDENTRLVGVNGLDMVSDIIGEEYDRVYRLYSKLKRKS